MRILLFIFIVSMLVGCTGPLKTHRKIDDCSNWQIFIRTQWEDETYLGAINPPQVCYLKDNLSVKIWRGYWDGSYNDGIIICNNNILVDLVPFKLITKTNYSDFEFKLDTFSRYETVCSKYELENLIDSLRQYKIPFYLRQDIVEYLGYQIFEVKYNITDDYRSVKYYNRASQIRDSIINNFKSFYPEREVTTGRYSYGGGDSKLKIKVSANRIGEIIEFDKSIYDSIKSVRKVTTLEYQPIEYLVYYFIQHNSND